MSEFTDADLLEAWAVEGSDEAFAALARRYGGLLYHAALRRTGRDDLAGEAAQNALLILARKAPGLTQLPSLAGWLHRTACYEASKLLRRECRHNARMKHFPQPDAGDVSWKDAAPLLDQALDELPEKDRQVIFLKYFDGLSFEQMARQFGGEPAAWRQRGSRAVERLRLTLTKRGVAVNAATLSTGLGTSFTQAAPPAVAASLSAAPAGAAAALSWQTLTLHSIHLMKLKPAVLTAFTVLVSLVPLGMQASALTAARSRIGKPEAARHPRLVELSSRQKPHTASAGTPGVSLVALADGLLAGQQGDALRSMQTRRRIDMMERDELERRLLDSGEIDLGPERRKALVHALFTRYCQLTPYSGSPPDRVIELAMRLASQMRRDAGDPWQPAEKRIGQWVDEAPEEAAAWYRNAWQSGALGEPSRTAAIAGKVFNALLATDRAAAIEFYRSLADAGRQAVIGGGGAFSEPDLLFELALDIEDSRSRGIALQRAFSQAMVISPAEVREWTKRVPSSDAEKVEMLVRAAKGPLQASWLTPEMIAPRLEWLRDAATGLDTSRAAGLLLAEFGRSDPGATFKTLDAEWQKNPDQRMLAAYIGASYFSETTMRDAILRSRLIEDDRLREESLRQMLLIPRPNDDAREVARKGGLTELELERIFSPEP